MCGIVLFQPVDAVKREIFPLWCTLPTWITIRSAVKQLLEKI